MYDKLYKEVGITVSKDGFYYKDKFYAGEPDILFATSYLEEADGKYGRTPDEANYWDSFADVVKHANLSGYDFISLIVRTKDFTEIDYKTIWMSGQAFEHIDDLKGVV